MTGTAKVTSAVSAKGRSKALTEIDSAQRKNGAKRWDGVERRQRSEQMSELAKQRWALHEQTDDQLREYFETEPLDKAMEAYQRFRKQFELAGQILDGRWQKINGGEHCSNPACMKQFDRNNPWFNRETKRHPITGQMYNEFACSAACMMALKGQGEAHARRRA